MSKVSKPVGKWNEGLTAMLRHVEHVTRDPNNANTHGENNLAAIRHSLEKFGQQKPIVILEDGTIIAGNGTYMAAQELGWTHVAAVVSDITDPAEAKAYALADNRTAQLAEWDREELEKQLEELANAEFNLDDLAFDETALLSLGLFANEDGDVAPPGGNGEATSTRESKRARQARELDLPENPETEPGDMWLLGRHKLICGDARDEEVFKRLYGDEQCDLVITDPPCCSGGFQEAGRQAGTWGTIAADNLSTRGYEALMKGWIGVANPQSVYIFTDWRVWIPLYDVVESSGIAVRSMIVWDKGSPALGILWRTQHELVMFGSRTGNKRVKGVPAIGNVIKAQRTGNKNHYTEKPIDLIAKLMKGDEPSGRQEAIVYDPFCGSGTTILAAVDAGRTCYAVDIEPVFCDIAVRRWEAYTGEKAERIPKKD